MENSKLIAGSKKIQEADLSDNLCGSDSPTAALSDGL